MCASFETKIRCVSVLLLPLVLLLLVLLLTIRVIWDFFRTNVCPCRSRFYLFSYNAKRKTIWYFGPWTTKRQKEILSKCKKNLYTQNGFYAVTSEPSYIRNNGYPFTIASPYTHIYIYLQCGPGTSISIINKLAANSEYIYAMCVVLCCFCSLIWLTPWHWR